MWILKSVSVHDITLGTTDDYAHNQAWMTLRNSDSIVFQVKACSDAYIALSESFDNTSNAYEIALGTKDNTNSEIRMSVGGISYLTRPGSVLSCDEYKTFWILLIHSTFVDVIVGEGPDVGSNALMHFNDPWGKDVVAVSFSTGSESTGSWRVSNVGGRYTILNLFSLHFFLYIYEFFYSTR